MNVVVSGNLFPLSIEIKIGEACSSKDQRIAASFILLLIDDQRKWNPWLRGQYTNSEIKHSTDT